MIKFTLVMIFFLIDAKNNIFHFHKKYISFYLHQSYPLFKPYLHWEIPELGQSDLDLDGANYHIHYLIHSIRPSLRQSPNSKENNQRQYTYR